MTPARPSIATTDAERHDEQRLGCHINWPLVYELLDAGHNGPIREDSLSPLAGCAY